jgi:5-methylcytosine-specific restriction enzyme subunit McrC
VTIVERSSLTVREYARLTTEHVPAPSLDRAQITPSAFAWLCQASSTFTRSGAALAIVENAHWLKLDNYVGVIETPCGTRIEILPKHIDDGGDVAASRSLLRRMIETAMELPVREVDKAALQRFSAPLSEWVIGRFLLEVNKLLKRGLRSDYVRTASEERFLRGQLDCSQQMRQPPGKQHLFQIRHDVFVHDRAENRLIKCALDQVARCAQLPQHWRLAQELREALQEIRPSTDVASDFRSWRTDRLMTHYRAVRPWCELILHQQMPYSLMGKWSGISFLFPMQRLFERFLVAWLKPRLSVGAILRAPAASEFLCTQHSAQMFRLEPDLLVESQGRRWILDAKWKRLDATDRSNKYGLEQSDIYQLFAYGKRYLPSTGGQMALIFPRVAKFCEALATFDFGEGLSLDVLPFDLESETLIDIERVGLPLRASMFEIDVSWRGDFA